MVYVLDDNYLAITAIVTVVFQFMFFVVTYLCRFDKLTDFAGGSNFVILALLTLLLGQTYYARQIVITTLTVVWGARLALFLLYRILQWGEDRRFDDKRDSLGKLAVFWTLQAVWVWTVSLPVTFINASEDNPPIGAADIIGWLMWAVGFLTESVADAQKTSFKNKAENKGKWCDAGLWAISRHPNYFGEILLWWGVFVASIPILSGGTWAAVLGPIFITLILLFVSGIPLLEQSMDERYATRPEYLQYKKHTSPLIPLPQSVYGSLPRWAKQVFLCEFPLYNSKAVTSTQSVNSV